MQCVQVLGDYRVQLVFFDPQGPARIALQSASSEAKVLSFWFILRLVRVVLKDFHRLPHPLNVPKSASHGQPNLTI